MPAAPIDGHARARPGSARLRASAVALVCGLLWTLCLPPAALRAEPTDDPTAAPSESPVATSSASPAASTDPSPTATAEPTASPTLVPTAVPTAAPTPAPTAAPTASPASPAPTAIPTAQPAAPAPAVQASPISGYRYTSLATSIRSARSLSSTPLAALPADTQVAVTETATVNGSSWTTAAHAAVTGYVPSGHLSLTSRPVAAAGTGWVGRPSGLRAEMRLSSGVTAAVPYGATITTSTSALDETGRRWYRASWSDGGMTRTGYLRTADVTSLPWAVRAGPWTALGAQALLRYPWSWGPAVRSLADGARVYRQRGLRDADGVVWVEVTYGSERGWLRHDRLAGPYAHFMWDRRDPVTQQKTNYWCVPASVQTELNMALNRRSTSRAFQQSAYVYGRANMRYRVQARGLDPQAWARSLNYFSGGRVLYSDTTFSTFDASLRAAAERMRTTGYPVGLLVYHGGHAWTMIGFTATADPALTPHYQMTGVYVAAPFVAWTDPRAGTYYTTGQIRVKMTTYWEPERWTRWNGRYTVILPVG